MDPKVALYAYTPNPEELIAKAYAICTGKPTIPLGNIPKWMAVGHLSPLEHASATFIISNISRVCSHQLVRHRISSYSQQSDRYVSRSNSSFVVPDSIANHDDPYLRHSWNSVMENAMTQYNFLINNGIPKEDARYVLPTALTTTIMVTMNFRSWIHFIALRTDIGAQDEIRTVAYEVWRQLQEIAPNVFSTIVHNGNPS